MTEEEKKPLWLISFYILIMTVGFLTNSWNTPWYLKYLAQLGVAGMGILWLFVTGDFKNLKCIGKYFTMYMIPFIGMISFSLGIWLVDFQSLNYISRGCSSVLYHIISLFMVCSAVYLFEEKAIEYTLYSMVSANMLIVLYSLKLYGVSAFLSGLILFIKTGGIETTPAIKTLEVHDLTFAFGLYIIYYLTLETQKKKKLYLIPVLICYGLGYKRIGVMGAAAAVAFHMLLCRLKEETQKKIISAAAVSSVGLCFLYVYIIRSEWFNRIVEYFQMDTMGRKELYDYFKNIYEFSPKFMGNGLGHVTRYISILTEEGVGIFGKHVFGGMHNDIVTLYIELGFWGFAFWAWYNLRFRIKWIMEQYGLKIARPLIYGTIYTFVTYATDNTVFYCYINTLFMLLPMAYALKIRHEEGKMTG